MIYFIADIAQWVSSLIGIMTIYFFIHMKFVQKKTLYSKRLNLPFLNLEISSQKDKELVIKIQN